jgi:hypothetical protein
MAACWGINRTVTILQCCEESVLTTTQPGSKLDK